MKPILHALVFLSCLTAKVEALTFEIDLPSHNIAYSPQTGMLYATIPSSAGVSYVNRLIEIAPISGFITDSVFVGSEPDCLAVSPDSPIAYVGLDGAAAVRQVDLTSMTAGIQFTLGPPMGFGPLYATQIAVMPGSPNTVAVSRHDVAADPDYQGLGIFDSGVMRTASITSFYGPTSISFGSSPNTLYGYDNYGQSTLYAMAVDASGVTVSSSIPDVIIGNGANILFDSGLIYATSGAVVDANTMQLVGTYQSSGPVVVDDSDRSVVFVNKSAIRVFDRDTFVPTFSLSIPNASGNPIAATGCGPMCIATVYDSDQIFIVPNVEYIFANGFE